MDFEFLIYGTLSIFIGIGLMKFTIWWCLRDKPEKNTDILKTEYRDILNQPYFYKTDDGWQRVDVHNTDKRASDKAV